MVTTTTGIATEFINFTRASNATVTDSDGKVKWAPHNLLTNSESFDAAAWGKTSVTVAANSVAAPNGTTTADRVTGNGISGSQVLTQTVALPFTRVLSVFAKAGTHSFIQLTDNQDVESYVNFNLSTGTVGTAGTKTSGIITPIGSAGWYLCQATMTSNLSGGNQIFLVPSASAAWSQSSNTSGYVDLWGVHLYRSDLGGMQANTSAYPMYNPTTPKNLLGQSEAFDVSPWSNTITGTGVNPTVTANAGLAPNGLQTADRIQFSLAGGTSASDISRRIQQFSTISGTPYTFSMWVKSYDGTPYTMQLVGANGSTTTLVSVTNEWQRVSVTANGTGANVNLAIGLRGGLSPANSNTADILVWGAQLSDSASLDTYSPVYGAAVTSAAYYGPRRDFDPVTLACKGLLVEEQRTNLLTYSAQFDDASWSKNGAATVTANTTVAPDGTTSADTVTGASGDPSVGTTDTVSRSPVVSSSTAYTASLYVRGLVGTTVTLLLRDGSTGLTASATATLTASWQRISCTLTSGAATTGFSLRIGGTNGTIAIWGAQFEAGSFATSYIPVGATTAGATRNGDVASVSTQAFPYNSTDGTWVANFQTLYSGTAATTVYVLNLDGSSSKRVLYLGSGSDVAASYDGTTIVSSTGDVTGSISKSASAYSSTDRAVVSNGGTVATGAIAAGFASASTAHLGNIGSNAGTSQLSGYIRQITYIPRRLSSTELQTRTT